MQDVICTATCAGGNCQAACTVQHLNLPGCVVHPFSADGMLAAILTHNDNVDGYSANFASGQLRLSKWTGTQDKGNQPE